MAAEYRDKRALITTVRGQYLSFATFLTPLLSHYPLPLNDAYCPKNFNHENPSDRKSNTWSLYLKNLEM